MRKPKRVGLMLAAAFVLMPIPALLDVEASPSKQPSSTFILATAAQMPVSRAGVAVNGTMKGAIDPMRIGEVYYVPFKDIAHLLGYDDITYSYASKTYRATDGSVTVSVTIGSSQGMKGDEPVTIHPPQLIKGTTYLSLDAVSAVFNTFTWFKAENGSVQVQLPARQYKVQPGDTLWKVAQAHHTTAHAVRSANGLPTDLLMVGQVLRLPSETDTKELDPVRPQPTPTQGDFYYDPYDDAEQPPAQVQNPPAPRANNNGGSTISSSSLGAKQQAILTTAKKYIGVPYKFGAKSTDAPRLMDCSSYVQYVYKVNSITLPRDSRQQSAVGTQVSALQPGDLLFFKYPEKYSDGRVGHVGIYIGNGQMIHTIPSKGVTITKYQTSSYWMKNFLFAKRVIR